MEVVADSTERGRRNTVSFSMNLSQSRFSKVLENTHDFMNTKKNNHRDLNHLDGLKAAI